MEGGGGNVCYGCIYATKEQWKKNLNCAECVEGENYEARPDFDEWHSKNFQPRHLGSKKVSG